MCFHSAEGLLVGVVKMKCCIQDNLIHCNTFCLHDVVGDFVQDIKKIMSADLRYHKSAASDKQNQNGISYIYLFKKKVNHICNGWL